MLEIKEIEELIKRDYNSKKKQYARIGVNYYEGRHDIRNYKLFYFDSDGELQEEKTRWNAKIPHLFFTELVDQETEYMLSTSEFIKTESEDKALKELVDINFNKNGKFRASLNDVVSGAIQKGFDYIYVFKNADGTFNFQQADSLGVVDVSKTESNDGNEYKIYHFISGYDKSNHAIRCIQVWDKQQVYYYKQIDNGHIELDDNEEINPRPHILRVKDNKFYSDNFGCIPFFKLSNNKKEVSGLNPIKDLIDDYDLMACGLTNNIQDAQEYIAIVKGYEGPDLHKHIKNMKTKKYIGVGENGDVDFKTISIPYEARKQKLEIDEKNIYRFGMGFNSAQLGDGNVTNVVIKSRYALLDLKCNKLEKQLISFLEDIVKLVFDDYNKENGTSYTLNDIYFDFEREIMTNALDNAQIKLTEAQTKQANVNTLLSAAGSLGNENIIEKLCDILELDYEEIKDLVPIDDTVISQQALDSQFVDE